MNDVDPATCEVVDGVAVIRLDDGKVNAISHRMIEAINGCLDVAEREGTSVAIIGRDGMFSAGFDLKEIKAGPDNIRALGAGGARLLMRIFGHPQPVVMAVTGHALAAGALLALTGDTRIGVEGPAKIGLNETAIGLGLPQFAVELAQARLSVHHLTRSAVQAQIYDPRGAVDAGYLDSLVDDTEACTRAAIAEARRLGELHRGAYKFTKRALRRDLIERVLAGLDEDMKPFGSWKV